MLNHTSRETLKSNMLVIMFVLLVILLIMLAWWVADTLMKHIDQHMPGL